MASAKTAPVISKSDFDEIEGRLTGDLKDWYEDIADAPPAPGATEETKGAFEDLPDVDSKEVVKASPIIRKYLGVDLDKKHIRKGGYESFDHLKADLLPKLRASCPDSLATDDASVTSAEAHDR